MSKTVTIIAVLAVIFLAGILIFSGNNPTRAETGTVYFAVTDAAADMGAVSSVSLTTDRVELQTDNGTWVTAADTQRSYDLLELNARNQTKLLARSDIEAGSYRRIRFGVSRVTVTNAQGSTTEATLPAQTVEFDSTVNVTSGATSTATFDIHADRSLHTSTDGRYVFAPVVTLETREEADVTIDTDNVMTVRSGTNARTVTVGMDLDGSSKQDFSIDPERSITIEADGTLNAAVDTAATTSSNAAASTGATTSVETETNADVDTSADAADTAETDMDAGAELETGTDASVDTR